eukprot:6173930-Pleurochrysis_carterae.AAC.3
MVCHEILNPLNGTSAYLQFAIGLLETSEKSQPSVDLQLLVSSSTEHKHNDSAICQACGENDIASDEAASILDKHPATTSPAIQGATGVIPGELSHMIRGALMCTNMVLRAFENLATEEQLWHGQLTLNKQPASLRDILTEVSTVLEPQLGAKREVELRVRLNVLAAQRQLLCDKKMLSEVRCYLSLRTREKLAASIRLKRRGVCKLVCV